MTHVTQLLDHRHGCKIDQLVPNHSLQLAQFIAEYQKNACAVGTLGNSWNQSITNTSSVECLVAYESNLAVGGSNYEHQSAPSLNVSLKIKM